MLPNQDNYLTSTRTNKSTHRTHTTNRNRVLITKD